MATTQDNAVLNVQTIHSSKKQEMIRRNHDETPENTRGVVSP